MVHRKEKSLIASFLMVGLLMVVSLVASKRVLMMSVIESGEMVLMMVSRSVMAIWWVSRSESLESEFKILCLSSTVAR